MLLENLFTHILTLHQDMYIRAVGQDLTAMRHQIFVKIQELVPDFFRTWTFAFVVLEIEKHIDLKVWNNEKKEE